MPKYKALLYKTEYYYRWVELESEVEHDAWNEAEKLETDIITCKVKEPDWKFTETDIKLDEVREIGDDINES